MTEPKVKVGILFEPEIEFVLLAPYRIDGCEVSGAQTVTCRNGQIVWQDRMYDELRFEPVDALSGSFEIRNVTIGINFHWERKEHQRFQGAFHLIVENDKLTGINVIGVEDYLISVISSEMSATASLELLKAHAVISRSWLLAQMEKNKTLADGQDTYTTCTQTDEELIKWYDREDHLHFDVCADDHCQRYQGITRASTETVREAVAATRGELLMYDGKICDARFPNVAEASSKNSEAAGKKSSILIWQNSATARPRQVARSDRRSRGRPVDTYIARSFLQYRQREDSLAGTQPLRSGDNAVLSVDGDVRTRRTGRTDPGSIRDRLRPDYRSDTCGTRHIRTADQAENCG